MKYITYRNSFSKKTLFIIYNRITNVLHQRPARSETVNCKNTFPSSLIHSTYLSLEAPGLSCKTARVALDTIEDQWGRRFKGKIVPVDDGQLDIEVFFNVATTLNTQVTPTNACLMTEKQAASMFAQDISELRNSLPVALRGQIEPSSLSQVQLFRFSVR